MKKIALALFMLVGVLIMLPGSSVYAATVTLPLEGIVRGATGPEIAALEPLLVDGDTTISGRGNTADLQTATGWDVNPDLDRPSGTHELVVVEWGALSLPECASDINLSIDSTISRGAMDISTQEDSLEWINALVKGTPGSPSEALLPDFDIVAEGRFKFFTSSSPYEEFGEVVPSTPAGTYTITNSVSSINTNALSRTDLQGDFFSFMYFDTYSPGPLNVAWNARINSAQATYSDSGCNLPPVIHSAKKTISMTTPSNTVVIRGSVLRASDPDGDELTYSITDGNTDDYFKINSETAAISTAKGSIPAGVYKLTVRVADGNGGFDTSIVTITVGTSTLANTGTGLPILVLSSVTLCVTSTYAYLKLIKFKNRILYQINS